MNQASHLSAAATARRISHRLLVPLLAVAAAGSLAPATSAATEVKGPAGLRIGEPPATVLCPPTTMVVSVRFTEASARRGVRGARVIIRAAGARKTVAAKRKSRRKVRMAILCGTTFSLRVEALGRRGKLLGRKTFVVNATPARGTTPGFQEPAVPPGAQVVLSTGTTWSATVDVRRGGPREGQTCLQVSATTSDFRGFGGATYCGLLSEDPFFVKTQELADPADGSKRLVVAGAVDLDSVGGVSLMSPAGTQQLPLSTADPNSPGGGGGFIAVFDATTTKVENLTLIVMLRNGSALRYPSPREINLRAQDGTRR